MLKQEANPPPSLPHKHHSPLNRTKTKLHPTIKHHHIPRHQPHPPQGFNDPLYEHLDGEVLNRQQHNFGPWVEPDRLKSRERAQPLPTNNNSGLPTIYRPQDTTTRYYQQQLDTNNENAGPSLLPSIRDRNQRAFSLQNLRPASLEFNPSEEAFVRTRAGTKTPFFLKMHGFALPKGVESDGSRKSNFIYNYCFQEADPLKPLLAKLKDMPRENEHYLKLGKAEPSTNQLLFQELKQHRINKLK